MIALFKPEESAYHRGSALAKRQKLMVTWSNFCQRPLSGQDNIIPLEALSCFP